MSYVTDLFHSPLTRKPTQPHTQTHTPTHSLTLRHMRQPAKPLFYLCRCSSSFFISTCLLSRWFIPSVFSSSHSYLYLFFISASLQLCRLAHSYSKVLYCIGSAVVHKTHPSELCLQTLPSYRSCSLIGSSSKMTSASFITASLSSPSIPSVAPAPPFYFTSTSHGPISCFSFLLIVNWLAG